MPNIEGTFSISEEKMMRRILTAKIVFLLTGIMVSAGAFAIDLTVEVSGYDKLAGTTMIGLFDNQYAFEKGGESVAGVRQQVVDEPVKVTFKNLHEGEYAVRVFNDTNNNGKLDKNMLGIPSEQYGFSNGGGRFGPPDFEKAKFYVTEDRTIKITLN